MPDFLDELYERSKDDHELIVGSDIRVAIGRARRAEELLHECEVVMRLLILRSINFMAGTCTLCGTSDQHTETCPAGMADKVLERIIEEEKRNGRSR